MFNILAITDNKLSSLNQCNSIINELKRISKKKQLLNIWKFIGAYQAIYPIF